MATVENFNVTVNDCISIKQTNETKTKQTKTKQKTCQWFLLWHTTHRPQAQNIDSQAIYSTL